MIATSTIFLFVAEIIIAITTPLVFFAILRFRKLTGYAPFFAGFSVYLVINLTIENFVKGLFFAEGETLSNIMKNNVFVSIFFTGLITIIFGEGVKFLVFRFVLQESRRKHDGLAYGAGFALIESVALTFMLAFVPVMYAGLINESGPEVFIQSVENHEMAISIVEDMQNYTNSGIILTILTLLISMLAQIGLSMICFYAVKRKVYKMMGLAVLLDFLSTIPSAMVTSGLIESKVISVLLTCLFTLLIVYAAARLFKDFDKSAVYPDIKTFFGIGGRRLGK